jgi:branched-chain amino acid transport system ATP-binding protein
MLPLERHAPMALQAADTAVLLIHGDVVASGQAGDLGGDWDSLHSSYLG